MSTRTTTRRSSAGDPGLAFLVDGGEMGARMRTHDWSASPLGPPEGWSGPLRTVVGIMLAANQPMFAAWGPERAMLYNDAYAEVLAARHPFALGRPFFEVWSELRDSVGPIMDRAYAGEPTAMDDIELVMTRHGYPEKVHFSFFYAPLRDEAGAIGGMYCACVDITAKVFAGRRTALRLVLDDRLRGLSDPAEVMAATAETLGTHLSAARVGYAEVDAAGIATVAREWNPAGLPSLIGRHRLDDYGPARVADLRAGWPEVIADFATDPRLSPSDVAIHHGLGIRAQVVVPLMEDGRLAAIFFVHAGVERRWHAEEVGAVADPADRTWHTVERARSETERRESETRFRALVNATADVVYRMSADWREMRRLDGAGFILDTEAPTSDWIETYIPADERPRVRAAIERAIHAKENFELEHRVLRADGRVGWTLSRAVPMLDAAGGIVEWFGAASDVTARREAETAARQADERLRLALDAAGGVGTWDWDVPGERIHVDASFGALYGITPERAAESPPVTEFIAALHPEDRPRVSAEIEAVLARGGEYVTEYRVTGLDRAERWVAVHGRCRHDENGRPVRFSGVVLDITDRKRIETEARESEARARFRVELGDALRGLTSPSEITATVAERVGRYLGVDQANYYTVEGDEYIVTDEWRTEASPGLVGRHRFVGFGADILGLMRAGEMLRLDDTRGTAGAAAFAAARMAAVLSAPLLRGGRWIGGLHVHVAQPRAWTDAETTLIREVAAQAWADVERARAEAELRALNADLERKVIERSLARGRTWQVSPDLIGVLNAEGHFEASNPAWAAVLGWSEEEVARTVFFDFIHPEDLPKTRAAWADAMRGLPALRFENRYRTKDGGWRWLSWVAVPDGVKVYCSARDITADKEREAELAKRTAERDRMWETTPDLMLVIDFEGVFRRVNPAWTAILGYEPEELVGHHVNEFVVLEDHWETTGAYEYAARGGKPSIENRYRHKDGSLRWISWVAAPVGEMTYAVGRDVTAEKERQAELAAAQEALRQAQKMEAVGQLTGGIAHDFNNMLQGVAGGLDLARRRIEADRSGEAIRYLDASKEAAERAATLTRRLLAFARRQPLDARPVDLDALVRSMAELVDRTVGPGVEVALDLAGGSWPVVCDPNQMESALVNLAINARDAMPGGGRLTISTRDIRLGRSDLGGHDDLRPGDFVEVAVTDTGEGMRTEVISRAFEPFYTTKPTGRGTGLGLSQVYGFVRQSGGLVRLESAPGRGTTVRLLLPRHAGTLPTAERRGEAEDVTTSAPITGTVLLVEDESAVREQAVEALREAGLTVHPAGDGATALALLRGGAAPDLLVSDVGLPGVLNGRQVAEAAREMRPGLPVLFITGYAGGALGDVLPEGMSVIVKPFALDALVDAARAALAAQPGASGSAA